MKMVQDGGRFLVRCEVGEMLPDALVELARSRDWTAASLAGIGAVQQVQLAYYDLQARSYLTFHVDGIVELVSLTGNLGRLDGSPFWHLHAAVADREGNVRGGHLVHLEVAITVECWIHTSSLTITRKSDDYSGLNLLDL
jgi:uncharacterized protein